MKRRTPLYQGFYNISSIAASSQNVVGLTLVHNAGAPWVLTSFLMTYISTTQAGAQIKILDSQHNRFFAAGSIVLGSVGLDRTLAAPRMFQPLDDPFVLLSGQSLFVYVTTTSAQSFAIGDLGLTVRGYQWQELTDAQELDSLAMQA